tara:strand:+ start:550 stop:1206 length:657 start_codon:yes stop_codon:yes gene_type:complete
MIIKIDKGRLFTVGDIHGCFDELEAALADVNFDKEVDTLIAVGDLVDRGPKSDEVEFYLDQPWFHSIMGNHEAMCHPAFAGTYWHVMNGGQWINDFADNYSDLAKRNLGERLCALPLWIEAHFNGKRFGFVHASVCGLRNWDEIKEVAGQYNKMDEHPFAWDRADFRDILNGKGALIQGIDHVYFGHTPVKEPFHKDNCSWIDTGAFATGKLTVMEVV